MGAPCCLVVFVRVSPMTSDVEHLRIRSFVSCASREVSLQVSGSFLISSFVFLSLTFKCSSSVLGNSQLSGVSFANIFFSVCGLSDCSFDSFFAQKKIFILIKFSLLIMVFMYRIFGIAFKKSSPNPRSSTFPPTLPARSFIVSPFAFRSAVHLVRWVRPALRCVSLRADTQSLQHRLWKRLSCFVELLLCQRSVGSLYVGLYSRLSVPFRRSVCLFC